jgi:predicted PurR-regulated permease PerM
MKPTSAKSKVNQYTVIGLLTITAFLFIRELAPYLGGFLAATAMYVILVGFQRELEALRWKKSIAASLLLIIATIIILIPIGLMGLMFTSKINDAIENKDEIVAYVQETVQTIEGKTGLELGQYIDAASISTYASTFLSNIANSGLTYFIIIGIMYFVLYYMLTERNIWQKACYDYLPFKNKNIKKLGKDSLMLIKSNAIGIPLVAFLQGIVALIGFLIFGVENAFFWFVVTIIGSMIPFVGTAVGIVPATIILVAQDHVGMAIGFLIYGIVVIGSTDNLFRLILQRKLADMHPLETLVGVVVGIPLFGFMGLIFGPVLVSLFLLVARMYKAEYVKKPVVKKEHNEL